MKIELIALTGFDHKDKKYFMTVLAKISTFVIQGKGGSYLMKMGLETNCSFVSIRR